MRDMVEMIRQERVVAEDIPEPIPHVTSLYNQILSKINKLDVVFAGMDTIEARQLLVCCRN